MYLCLGQKFKTGEQIFAPNKWSKKFTMGGKTRCVLESGEGINWQKERIF